jgi:hypothetical protein
MKPNRLHEETASEILGMLDPLNKAGRRPTFVFATVMAALVHAILDLAQATREANVR